MILEDFSFGVIPFREVDGQWQALMVQLHAGHWGFPKGHGEPGESGQESATRELREETGLDVVSWIPLSPFQENYSFTHKGFKVSKCVTYYPAFVSGDVLAQADEVKAIRWVPVENLEKQATFEEGMSSARQGTR